MAGGQERTLKRRIKSVNSTKKITRAMELISASRIAKAQLRLNAARPYAEKITEVLSNLQAAGASSEHALLRNPDEVKKVGYVVITADRGLAGGYNASIVRLAEIEMKRDQEAGRETFLLVVGRKGISALGYKGYHIDVRLSGFSDNPGYDNAKAIAKESAARFESGELDQVKLIYTQFLSVGTQRAVVRQLVPLQQETDLIIPGASKSSAHDSTVHNSTVHDSNGHDSTGHHSNGQTSNAPQADYEFEPSPSAILDQIIPRYVEARLFAMLLECAGSEHAARQRAMKAATDNADELAKVLTRSMNRARQEAITTEIMEIVGGAEALSTDDPEELFAAELGLTEDDREQMRALATHKTH